MRILLVVVVLLIVTGAACGGGGDDEGRANAVRAVFWRSGTPEPGIVPAVAQDFECVIAGGGPYPGIRVPGVCRWDAERDGDGWIVSEKQTWRCEDFNAITEGKEACTGETGWHTYRYRLDPDGGVSYLDDSGIFPPGAVE